MATYNNFLNTDITNKKKLQEDIAAFREQHFPVETEPPTTSNDTSDFVKRSNERYRSMLTRQIYNRDFDWEPIQTVGDLNPNQYYGTSVYDKGASNISDYANLNNYRADEQSGFLKLVNGTVNALFKLGTSAVNAVATIPTMGIAAITKNQDDRSWFAEWATNPITQGLQNMEDAFKQNIAPIYRDDSSRERSWAQNAITPGSGFWGEDVIENIGFTLGSLYGGKAVVGAFNKIANRISTKVGTRALSRLAAAQGESGVKAFVQENIGKSAQELENAFSQINNRFKGFGSVAVGVTTGALGEAQMEASHAYNDYIEQNINYANSFFDKNNPSLQIMYYDAVSKGYEDSFEKYIEEKRNETYADIKRTADSIAKGVFGVQSILLTATNWLTFANFFKGGSGLRSNMMMRAKPFLDVERKKVVTSGGKKISVITGAKTRKRPLLTTLRIAEPAFVEGFEEMGQGFITEAYTQYNGALLNDDFYKDYKLSLNPAYEQNAIDWLNSSLKGWQWMTDFNNQIEGLVGAVFGAVGIPGGRIRKSKQKTPDDKFGFKGGIQESIQELRTAKESAQDIVKKVEDVIKGNDEKVTFSTLKNYYTLSALTDIESFAQIIGDKKTELDAQHGKVMAMARLYNEMGMSDDFLDLLDSIANMNDEESDQFIKTLEQLYLKEGQTLSETEKKEVLENVKNRVKKQKEETEYYYQVIQSLRKTLGRQFNSDDSNNTNAKLGDDIVMVIANNLSVAKNKENRVNELTKKYADLLTEISETYLSKEEQEKINTEKPKKNDEDLIYTPSQVIDILRKSLPELTEIIDQPEEETKDLAENYENVVRKKLQDLDSYKTTTGYFNINDAIVDLMDLYTNSIEFQKCMKYTIGSMGTLLNIKEAKKEIEKAQKQVDEQQLANIQTQILAYAKDTNTENYNANLKTVYGLLQQLKDTDYDIYNQFKETQNNIWKTNKSNPLIENALSMMMGEEIKETTLNRLSKKHKISHPTVSSKLSELFNVSSDQLKAYIDRKKQDSSMTSADLNDWNLIEQELRSFYGDKYDELSTNRVKFNQFFKNKVKFVASPVEGSEVPARSWDTKNEGSGITTTDEQKKELEELAQKVNYQNNKNNTKIEYLGDGKILYSYKTNIRFNRNDSNVVNTTYSCLYDIFTNKIDYIKFIGEDDNEINIPTDKLYCTSNTLQIVETYLQYILNDSSFTTDFAKKLKSKIQQAENENKLYSFGKKALSYYGAGDNVEVNIFADNYSLVDSEHTEILENLKNIFNKLNSISTKQSPETKEKQGSKYSNDYETERENLKKQFGIVENENPSLIEALEIIKGIEKTREVGLDTIQSWLNDRGFYAVIEGEGDEARIKDIVAFEDQDGTGYTLDALTNTYVRWTSGNTIKFVTNNGSVHEIKLGAINSNNTIAPVVTTDGLYRLEYVAAKKRYQYTPLKNIENRTPEQVTTAHNDFMRNTEIVSFGDFSDAVDGKISAGNSIRFSINKILNSTLFKDLILDDQDKSNNEKRKIELINYLIKLHQESYSYIGSGKLNQLFTENPNLQVQFRKKQVDSEFKSDIKKLFNLENIIDGSFLVEIFVTDNAGQTHSLGFVKPDVKNGNVILLGLSEDPKFKTNDEVLDYTTTIDKVSVSSKKVSVPEEGTKPIKDLLGISDGLTPRIIIINNERKIIADNGVLKDNEKLEIEKQLENSNMKPGAKLVLYQIKSGKTADGTTTLPYEILDIENAQLPNTKTSKQNIVKISKGVQTIHAFDDILGLQDDSLISRFFKAYKEGRIEDAKTIGFEINDMLKNRLYSSLANNYVKVGFHFDIENGENSITIRRGKQTTENGKQVVESDTTFPTGGNQSKIEFDENNPNLANVINKIYNILRDWEMLIQFDTESMNPNVDTGKGYLPLQTLIDERLISVASNTVYETHGQVVLKYSDLLAPKTQTQEKKQQPQTTGAIYNLENESFGDQKFTSSPKTVDSSMNTELTKMLDKIVKDKNFSYRKAKNNRKFFVITDKDNNHQIVRFSEDKKGNVTYTFETREFKPEKWNEWELIQKSNVKATTKKTKSASGKNKSTKKAESQQQVVNITVNVGSQEEKKQPEQSQQPVDNQPTIEEKQIVEEQPEVVRDARREKIKEILSNLDENVLNSILNMFDQKSDFDSVLASYSDLLSEVELNDAKIMELTDLFNNNKTNTTSNDNIEDCH